MRRSFLVALAALSCALPSPVPARPIALEDLARLKTVGAPDVDPAGEWVAYTVASVDVEADKTNTHVWMTTWDGSRSIQLTGRKGESETIPRFSPDGRWLAFLSSRAAEKENDQLWLLDRAGGEARRPAELPGSVVDYAWSPNGRQIALIVADPDPDDAANAAAQAVPPAPEKPGAPPAPGTTPPETKAGSADANAKAAEKKPKPIVIDRFQFKRDIDGYLGKQRQRLVLLDVQSGRSRRLTDGDFDEHLPAWSPDGRRIAFVSNRDSDPDRSYNFDLFTVDADAAGAAPTRLTTFAGADNDPETDSYPAWSPDGRSIAYLQGGPVELIWYAVRTLAVVPSGGGSPRMLTAGLDRNVRQPVWAPDGRSLRVIVEDDRAEYIARVPASGGRPATLAQGRRVVQAFDANARGRTAVLMTDPRTPAEVYALEGDGLRPLSRQNASWLAEVTLAPTVETRFRSADGTEVHGLVVRPNGAAAPLPTLLRIHGGPVAQYDLRFDFERQLYAANGYAVIAANPRGSSGRGQDYSKAIYAAWGSVDVADVLAAVDDAVARGVADPARLGVGGWSYGGMLTNYVIASDTRFRAATSGAGIANILAGYGTDEYVRDYEAELGAPWEKPETWMRVSYPFFRNDRIVTPTLFLSGQQDFNVPLLGSEQMYQALKSRGIDTRLVIYPGEKHGLKRPSFVRDRLWRYLDWYDARVKAPAAASPARTSGY